MFGILTFMLLSVEGVKEVDIEDVRAVEEVDVKGAVEEVGVDDDELFPWSVFDAGLGWVNSVGITRPKTSLLLDLSESSFLPPFFIILIKNR